jgi:hypothetical protein
VVPDATEFSHGASDAFGHVGIEILADDAPRRGRRGRSEQILHECDEILFGAGNRPHTSNDNPFSESHFKTLKYQPRFPKRFGCIDDARSFCRSFFDWYNQDHHHGGIGLMTPDPVHYGKIDAVHAARQLTLDQAFRENPERFVKKPPTPPAKPTAAWINPPTPKSTA